MERLVRELRSVKDRKSLSPIYERIMLSIADVLTDRRMDSEKRNAAEAFARALGQVDHDRLRFFKPNEQIAIVASWNRLWRLMQAELASSVVGIESTDVTRDNVLRLVCRFRAPIAPVSVEAERRGESDVDIAESTANSIPTALNERYVRQAAFTLIRAKKWLKKSKSDISKAASRMLNTVAPNVRFSDGSGSYAHIINDELIHLIRLVDARCRNAFKPARHGANSLKVVIENVPKDAVLLSEAKGVLEMASRANCPSEVASCVLNAMVHGAGSSLGKHLLEMDKAQRKKPDLSVALRTGFKVSSSQSKR